jgi:hypothetical protein
MSRVVAEMKMAAPGVKGDKISRPNSSGIFSLPSEKPSKSCITYVDQIHGTIQNFTKDHPYSVFLNFGAWPPKRDIVGKNLCLFPSARKPFSLVNFCNSDYYSTATPKNGI